MAEHVVAVWTSALDALEAALDEGESASPGSWTPPPVDAPIPAELVARARSIQGRQRSALALVGAELGALRRHRSAVGSVRAATLPAQASVYIDTTG
ncbi:hypothetical protein E8P82_13055 [Arthrobacter echini]|uniref:Uncharacterized protein n=1 Tax=Arthrobacter echini TaxID=1529066 RepID=A0A4S5E1A1_9MICC|nr:hypothetical protein [Arthrobacter echini]THJ65052.1 hypothetical protein E8P82_13055 [Arthrobacter echini]